MKPRTFLLPVCGLIGLALLAGGPLGCIVRAEPAVVVGPPPPPLGGVVVVDEFGYRHEGYYDEHHFWHGYYFDEHHVRHEDARDWRHDRR